jgi:hypothetical protein
VDAGPEVNGVQELEVDVGPEVNGVQELEVDVGPEVNGVQELGVDAGPEVNGVQELEVDGRQGLEVRSKSMVSRTWSRTWSRKWMAGRRWWLTSMRWAAYASRPCCHLQSFLPSPQLRAVLPPEPSTSFRASDLLQTPSTESRSCLPLPPDLAVASRASYYLHSLRSPPGLPATSRASCRLQSFVLCCLLESSTSFRAFDLPQSLRPPPGLPAASRASRRFQSFPPPPEASCRLQSFVLATSEPSTSSRAFDRLQSFVLVASKAFDLLQSL